MNNPCKAMTEMSKEPPDKILPPRFFSLNLQHEVHKERKQITFRLYNRQYK